ncbi:1,6-anhydro-N-acetylmuramyl-L-alanine amidase AmpD [Orrella marina]|uniref:1,6-anhydro-N-acetylmuramyl-L-alanine amidase AmpD n=1 Tax=Orrella marina TaxID=2163011 RepID=A0A2R4XKQ7_9BURK|nr:1,6-anhydro-N-acetylmuramyl-L-alanine amidase AmpD [Orrella marina]AWB34380.1 1,6-anhydro-N-acetylmuramyl-L-alanine amidase AmpD [Orrella marina]
MIHIHADGWLAPERNVTIRQSDNHDQRQPGVEPDLLVIHNISLPPGEFGTGCPADLFCNALDFEAHPWFENIRGLKVSAHLLIDRTGHITQFVSCNDRAWHAGLSMFQGRSACNDFSIGIELEGTDDTPYTDAQYDSLGRLTRALRARYPLTAALGHCHIAPDRKTDPGSEFDWDRFGQLTNWPESSRPPRLIA